jgi:hypothetical protein
LTNLHHSIYLRCDAKPDSLDQAGSHRRRHEKTDFLIQNYDAGVLWDDFGIRSDIVVRINPVLPSMCRNLRH